MSRSNHWMNLAPSRKKQSLIATTILLVNSVYATGVLFLSGLYSFLGVPMFGDEFESSPSSMVVRSLVIIFVIDTIAVWRFRKLNTRWLPTGRYKYLKWFYQAFFVGVIGISNIGFLAVAWFWLWGLIG